MYSQKNAMDYAELQQASLTLVDWAATDWWRLHVRIRTGGERHLRHENQLHIKREIEPSK